MTSGVCGIHAVMLNAQKVMREELTKCSLASLSAKPGSAACERARRYARTIEAHFPSIHPGDDHTKLVAAHSMKALSLPFGIRLA